MTFQELTMDRSSFLREAASSNKHIKFAPYGRRTSLSLRRLCGR